ncbi:MAG: lysoplasmalogenase [Chakrabartia sp.]
MDRPRIAKWAYWASLIAGISYLAPVVAGTHGPLIILWKGLGVGFLAVYAALNASDKAGVLITLIMALGAAADVVLDVHFSAGAALFALGHCVAIALYWQNRRPVLPGSQRALVATTLVCVPLIAGLLAQRLDVVVYTLFLAAMAATAWASRFPRYQTGLGAMMFVASDLLIFGRMGPLADWAGIGVAVWGLYYAGQALIVRGVVQTQQDDAGTPR